MILEPAGSLKLSARDFLFLELQPVSLESANTLR